MDSEQERLIVKNNNSDSSGLQDTFVNPLLVNQAVVNYSSSEKQPDIKTETKVYKRRWYILTVYTLAAATQGGLWNTWGPIAASAEEAFDWTDADIALLANFGPIAYVISAVFFSWVVDTKGLRVATLSMIFFMMAATGIRCITDKTPYVKWTMNIGQFLNGFAGPIAMGMPPALSVAWFPPNERTTSTALQAMLAATGPAFTFLLGPYIVSDIPKNDNTTINHNSTWNTTSDNDTEAAWVALISLPILIYFPAKPKLPPSIAASKERLNFVSGLKRLLRNKQFVLVALSYNISAGVFDSWQGVLDVNLKPHDISETEVGWLGFYSIWASIVAAIIVARFADIFTKRIKLILILLNIIGAGCFVWFALLINAYIPISTVTLYVSVILGNLFVGATPALYFEMACEVSYPVAEGVTNIVITWMTNMVSLMFLFVQMIPNIGTAWENWCLIGATVVCVPFLLMAKERYHRLDIDTNR